MEYIIMDMEWNQPVTKAATITEPVMLTGEVIRIGAVRLDIDLNETGQYHRCVIPKYYKKMNSAVEKLTGIKAAAITYGLRFPVAFGDFMKWCGNDCAILTWGGEDEKILRMNMELHGISTDCLPKMYDLQIIFAHRIRNDGKQYGVAAALEYYSLPSDLKAHNALNDAIFAARIGKKMDFPRFLPEYEEILASIEERKSEKYIINFLGIESPEAALKDRRVRFCCCPKCRKIMKTEKFVMRSKSSAYSSAVCKNHGEYYIRLKMTRCPDGTYSVTRRLTPMTPEIKELCTAGG